MKQKSDKWPGIFFQIAATLLFLSGPKGDAVDAEMLVCLCLRIVVIIDSEAAVDVYVKTFPVWPPLAIFRTRLGCWTTEIRKQAGCGFAACDPFSLRAFGLWSKLRRKKWNFVPLPDDAIIYVRELDRLAVACARRLGAAFRRSVIFRKSAEPARWGIFLLVPCGQAKWAR